MSNDIKENIGGKNNIKVNASDSSVDHKHNINKETNKKLIKSISVSGNEDIDEDVETKNETLTLMKKYIQKMLAMEGEIFIERYFESEEEDLKENDEHFESEMETKNTDNTEARQLMKNIKCIYCYKKGSKGCLMDAMDGWEENIDGQALVVYKCKTCMSMILK